MKTLKEAKRGQSVRGVRWQSEGALKRRIMEMGITKGVDILIRKLAPLGDSNEMTVRGYELLIRKDRA